MSRLYDHLMRMGAFGEFSEAASFATKVDVTSVYRARSWPLDATPPHCSPPFIFTFLEFVAPRSGRAGILCYSFHSVHGHKQTLLGAKANPDARFILFMLFYNKHGESGVTCEAQLDTSGDLIDATMVPGLGVEVPDEDRVIFEALVDLALFSFSLMNAKNVELVEQAVPPRLAKKHARKHEQPPSSYYTLKVNPMRAVKHGTGVDSPDGKPPQHTAIRLHLQRGHFKDYRDGRGLFGKYKDVFWWDQHVRGSADNGQIVKDYKVLPYKAKEDQS